MLARWGNVAPGLSATTFKSPSASFTSKHRGTRTTSSSFLSKRPFVCTNTSQGSDRLVDGQKSRLRVRVADLKQDACGVADTLSEVFNDKDGFSWIPGWVPRVIRVLQYADLQRRELSLSGALPDFLPDCSNRHSYLVAVAHHEKEPNLAATAPNCSDSAPNFAYPHRAPTVVSAVLNFYLRQEVFEEGKTRSEERNKELNNGAMVEEPSSTLWGVISLDTFTEFMPPRREPRGMPDPLFGPHRFERRKIGYISNLAVRHERRRQGIGQTLLRSAELRATQWGCRSVCLHCAIENKGAIQMYEAAGFRHVANEYSNQFVADLPEFIKTLAGVEQDHVLMLKRLKS